MEGMGRKERRGERGEEEGTAKREMLNSGFVTPKGHIMCAEPRLFDVFCVNARGASWL